MRAWQRGGVSFLAGQSRACEKRPVEVLFSFPRHQISDEACLSLKPLTPRIPSRISFFCIFREDCVRPQARGGSSGSFSPWAFQPGKVFASDDRPSKASLEYPFGFNQSREFFPPRVQVVPRLHTGLRASTQRHGL